jgi:UDP-N-acetylmuramyl pentapeptide phosphotransferase/UDP-N-acetylglucosamine-1-phosphate transferase
MLWQAAFSCGVLLWLVAYTNAFNFMDGINGISVAQVVVAGAAWWALGVHEHAHDLATAGAMVAAAGLAFAPFNAPTRARMFLGDVGSYFLGGWLAATAVIGLRSGIPPEAILAPLALYCADTSTTLIRRIRRGEAWTQPHREHRYQRLVQSGWSHQQTSLTVALAMAICAGLGALSITGSLALRVVGDALIGIILVGYLMKPVSRSRRHGSAGSRAPQSS